MNRLTLSTTLLSLVDRLDDTDGNRLSHVTHGEASERWVLVVRLDTHGLARDKLGYASITRLDEFGGGLQRFAASSVDLLDELGELAGDVCRVAIQHRCVTSADLTGVVQDDYLSVEGCRLLGRVILRV